MAQDLIAKQLEQIPMLLGPSNYPQWETAMVAILKKKGVWDVVGGCLVEVPTATKTDMDIDDPYKGIGGEEETETQSDEEEAMERHLASYDPSMATIIRIGLADMEREEKELEIEQEELEMEEQECCKEMNEEASRLIMRSVEGSIKEDIRSLSSAHEMWNNLQLLHGSTEADQH